MSNKPKQKKIRLGITLGDVNGIGPEVILKTFSDSRVFDFCIPVIFASAKTISYHKKVTHLKSLTLNILDNISEIKSRKLNVLNCWPEEVQIDLGKSTDIGGQYALKSLEAASEALENGDIDVLLTSPINKHNIQSETFQFPGHTEYLAEKFGQDDSLMFMVDEQLKVGVVTGHIPVSEVSSSITEEKILKKLTLMQRSLIEDFGIGKPRIAVLGLNPHTGDNGLIGKEDDELIRPTIQKAFEDGLLAFGPYAADSFFGSGTYSKFDAVLAMYHDQGLVPFKTLSFGRGVNFTAGLPYIRTSPDHGTGYDIAGKNTASVSSFREALFLACSIYKKRAEYMELDQNKLRSGQIPKRGTGPSAKVVE